MLYETNKKASRLGQWVIHHISYCWLLFLGLFGVPVMASLRGRVRVRSTLFDHLYFSAAVMAQSMRKVRGHFMTL